MPVRTDLPEDLRPVARGVEHVRVSELDDGLWCLRLPLPYAPMPSVNVYLLSLAGGLCLVDCGTSLDPAWEALERAFELAGQRIEDVRLLVCTHLHADHAGLAAALVERTGCELCAGSARTRSTTRCATRRSRSKRAGGQVA